MATAGYQLLWAVIRDNVPHLFADLRKDLFLSTKIDEKPSEVALYEAIVAHKNSYRQLPSADVLRQNGFPVEGVSEPVSYYYERLLNRNTRNKTIELQRKFNQILKENKGYDSVATIATSFARSVNEVAVSNKFKTLTEIAEEYVLALEQAELGVVKKVIPFGWPSLDKVAGGGMYGGDVIYAAARPGKGKSSLTGSASYKAYTQGFSPLVFSMEMVDRAFGGRVIAEAAKINPNALRMLDADFHAKEKLKKFIEDSKNGPNYYIAEGAFRQTPDTIANLVDRLNPDIVYIDASYLVSPKLSNAAKWERLSEVGEDIKKIALSYDIPIFQTVQFNREAGKKNVYDLETIGGGDFTGQLGSIVIAIKEGDGIHEEDRRKLSVKKNRDGDLVDLEVNFKFNPPNFDEVLEDDDYETAYDEEFPI